MTDLTDLKQLLAFHRGFLKDDLLPWWSRHAIDWDKGGICSCIADDGTIQSRDKYIWSQLRAVWTFSAAYNRVEPKQEWLDIATCTFDFAAAHGRNPNQDWVFTVSEDGEVLRGAESIQTDAFAICALAEYARATGDTRAIDLARQTYDRSLARLRQPGSYQTAPYPIPDGTKAHRVSMQFSLAFHELGKLLNDPDMLREGLDLTDDVLENFRRPELQAHLEYLSLDNQVLPPTLGTLMGPGHGIETAWFQIENLRGRNDPQRVAKALQIMRWSLEKGWDPEYGGLYLNIDIAGGEPHLPNADKKIWWPHCEALCGTLMAHEACSEDWCMEWYQKVHAWSFQHFTVREHGEWTQRLDRTGKRISDVVALPVKDPFHLPRAVIYCIQALERLTA